MEANEVTHSLCICEYMYMKEASKEGRTDGPTKDDALQFLCVMVVVILLALSAAAEHIYL
jgi:hypothetical protein